MINLDHLPEELVSGLRVTAELATFQRWTRQTYLARLVYSGELEKLVGAPVAVAGDSDHDWPSAFELLTSEVRLREEFRRRVEQAREAQYEVNPSGLATDDDALVDNVRYLMKQQVDYWQSAIQRIQTPSDYQPPPR